MIKICQCKSLFLDDIPVVFVIANSLWWQSLVDPGYWYIGCAVIAVTLQFCALRHWITCDILAACPFGSDILCALIFPWLTKLTLHFSANIIIRTFIAANKAEIVPIKSPMIDSRHQKSMDLFFYTLEFWLYIYHFNDESHYAFDHVRIWVSLWTDSCKLIHEY